jgi:hypothetical protein
LTIFDDGFFPKTEPEPSETYNKDEDIPRLKGKFESLREAFNQNPAA